MKSSKQWQLLPLFATRSRSPSSPAPTQRSVAAASSGEAPRRHGMAQETRAHLLPTLASSAILLLPGCRRFALAVTTIEASGTSRCRWATLREVLQHGTPLYPQQNRSSKIGTFMTSSSGEPSVREVVERFQAGESLRRIAASTGLSRPRVRQFVSDAGVAIHPHHAAALPNDPAWWTTQFDDGRSVAQIAELMSTNQMNVYRHLRKIGLPSPRSQPVGNWIAARTIRDGECWRWTKSVAHGRPSGSYAGSYSQSARHILWEHTYGPVPDGSWVVPTPECVHSDCVALHHIRLITPQAHVAERVEARRFRWGADHGMAKLTETAARDILQQRTTDPNDLATRHGVSKSTIYAIWAGRRWAHLTQHD